MTKRQLRIAVSTAGPIGPWQARCVEALAAVPGVLITRWLRSGTPDEGEAAATDGVLPDALEAVVVDADQADARAPGRAPDQHVDVLLDLTSDGSAAAPWASEVWRYGFGRELSRDLGLVVLQDYVRGPGITRVALLREPGEEVLHEGWMQSVSCWHPTDLERVMLSPAGWPAAAAQHRMAGLDVGTASSTNQAGSPKLASGGPRRVAGPASLPTPALKYAAVGRRVLGMADSILKNDDWNVGVLDAPIGSLLASADRQPVTWLPSRPGHFAADPFGLERDGVLHILYEDFDQRRGIGSIHHIALGPDGTFSSPEPVLELDVHLSYPFLIEREGTVYMLPEAAGSGELVLFEATDFPRAWRPAATLLPGIPAIDASVVRFEDRWWMFADRLDRGVNHDLFIWHAPDLLGPWTPHAENPVKTDVRSARPGGTPFVSNGALYRPSQDSSWIYGGRLIINQILALTPTVFEERPVRMIEPRAESPYPDGLHHLSGVGRRTLIDGNRRHFVPDALRARLGR